MKKLFFTTPLFLGIVSALVLFLCNAAPFVSAAGATYIGGINPPLCDYITGWACDTANYGNPLATALFKDGPYGTGTLFWANSANNSGGGYVAPNCGGNDNHAFVLATPAALKDGKSHTIYAYPMSADYTISGPLLSGSGKVLTCGTVPGSGNDLACMGDSITVGYMGGAVYADKSYCSLLKTTYGYNTQNFGVGGDPTANMLSRTGNLTGKGFEYSVLLAGTTEVDPLFNSRTTEQAIYNNLSGIAQALAADGQKTVISTIPPWPASWGVGLTVTKINNIIRRISYEKNLCYADIYASVFNGQVTDTTFLFNGVNDGVHPNDAAQVKIAAAFDAALKNCSPYNCSANPQNCYVPEAACASNCSGKICGDNGCGGSCGSCSSGQTCSAGVCSGVKSLALNAAITFSTDTFKDHYFGFDIASDINIIGLDGSALLTNTSNYLAQELAQVWYIDKSCQELDLASSVMPSVNGGLVSYIIKNPAPGTITVPTSFRLSNKLHVKKGCIIVNLHGGEPLNKSSVTMESRMSLLYDTDPSPVNPSYLKYSAWEFQYGIPGYPDRADVTDCTTSQCALAYVIPVQSYSYVNSIFGNVSTSAYTSLSNDQLKGSWTAYYDFYVYPDCSALPKKADSPWGGAVMGYVSIRGDLYSQIPSGATRLATVRLQGSGPQAQHKSLAEKFTPVLVKPGNCLVTLAKLIAFNGKATVEAQTDFEMTNSVGTCVPNCSGKICGSNGCGGSCGTCAAGQACSNNACVAGCVSKTCAQLGNYTCGSWPDGCGSSINCGVCPSGKACSGGVCVANCVSHVFKKCDGGNLYWYNSCDSKEALYQNCGVNTFTDNYRCSANLLQRETVVNGCSNNICTSVSSWVNDHDCTMANQTCAAGACRAPVSCQDECSQNQKRCSDNGYAACGNFDDDPCLEWSTVAVCGVGEECVGGVCRALDCSPKTCADLGYSCGDFTDTCSGTLECGSCLDGKTCFGGICVSSSSGSNNDDLDSLYSQIKYLQKEIARIQALLVAKNQTIISCRQITKVLRYGMVNDSEVKCLQEFLKTQGLLTANATGNYYALTKSAVAAFQQKYAREILAPFGLKYGSGNVGNSTREKINTMIGK